MRPNTNSTGTSSNASRTPHPLHRPSLSSFPSSSKRSVSHSTLNNNDLALNTTRSSGSHPSSAHSYHSSLSASQHPHDYDHGHQYPVSPANGHGNIRPRASRRQRPVRSQYPATSDEKHVEYILVASFDIDRGSIMEHQYPGPVGGDEHMLAELMLPDQTHLRSQDWTVFFLHKDAAAEEEDEEDGLTAKKRRRRQRSEAGQASAGAEDEDEEDEDSSDDEGPVDGPPLVYVLNLVNTKQDNTVKRGAVVKAMAICTRHSFLHIYKPLLLIALEQYFANPHMDTLAELYHAVNSMDLSLMPKLNAFERFILQSSDTKDLFIEKFEAIIAQQMAANDRPSLSHKESKDDTTALPTLSPKDINQPLARRYGLPRDTHEFESVVNYANIPVPIKVPTALSPETVGDFSLIKLITTFSTPHSTSPVAFAPTHPHLTTNGSMTHPIIVLLNAMLTQKRVIFMGHNLPSSEVAEAVLGACALASGGMLRGFTRHAFPYTDLTKIDDLLKVPGFIAGVTNPAFAFRNEWWDVLCDLSTGRVKISSKIEQAPLTEGVAFFHNQPPASAGGYHAPGTGGMSALAHAGASLSAGLGGGAAPTGATGGDLTGDAAFMQSVIKAIEERHGENAIRSKFRKWVLKFTRLAAAFEETVYGASALHIQPSPKLHNSPFFVNADSPGVSNTTADSPVDTDGARKASQFDADHLPPEVTGHGYVWPTPGLKSAELAANATRIEGWRNTRSYYNCVQDLAGLYIHRPVKSLDLQHLHDKLAKLRLGHEPAANIYLALCAAVQTDSEICQLLAVCIGGTWDHRQQAGSVGQGSGLFYLAMGLLHPRVEVRESVADLLTRIQEHEAGRHFWAGVGRFGRVAFERVLAGREARLAPGAAEGGE
ncbi:hypothetical protein D0869_08614 [Hortaea werneckii]|nr:hypothetical protein D0869_08614 [Hortaea werneckii]RMX91426.1 hypothetical protein D0868_13998 [Hortaea werneckii]RMX99764.1 hypothetical protein D0867_11979 [Hortaea werneckii]